jgi:hypothetical protein
MDTSPSTSKQTNSEHPMQQPNCEAAKPMKPPPIIIHQVRDYDIIYRYLNTKLEHKYKVTLLNNGDLKLNVDTEDLYRTASKMLMRHSSYGPPTKINKPDPYGLLSRNFIVHVPQTR